jgi:hypothetical protein
MSVIRRMDLRGPKDIGAPGGILFEDVVLHRAPEFVETHPLLFSHGQVHGHDDGAGGIDGHGGGDLVQGNALEEALHVPQGVDGHPDFAHLPLGQGWSES